MLFSSCTFAHSSKSKREKRKKAAAANTVCKIRMYGHRMWKKDIHWHIFVHTSDLQTHWRLPKMNGLTWSCEKVHWLRIRFTYDMPFAMLLWWCCCSCWYCCDCCWLDYLLWIRIVFKLCQMYPCLRKYFFSLPFYTDILLRSAYHSCNILQMLWASFNTL